MSARRHFSSSRSSSSPQAPPARPLAVTCLEMKCWRRKYRSEKHLNCGWKACLCVSRWRWGYSKGREESKRTTHCSLPFTFTH